MTFLLGVNVLIVLHQPNHNDYKMVRKWFASRPNEKFATCPLTQAALLRLLTQEIEGLDRFSMDEAYEALNNLVQHPRHVYWPDSPTYLEATLSLFKRMQGHRQITDAYLLGLAAHNRGKLATIDRGVIHLAGRDLAANVELIEPGLKQRGGLK